MTDRLICPKRAQKSPPQVFNPANPTHSPSLLPHPPISSPTTSSPPRAIPATQLPPSSFHAPLKLAVADNEDILFLAADELDALIDPGVQLIQTRDLMAQIQDRPPLVVDLVEDVVAEQLEVVALAGFGPGV